MRIVCAGGGSGGHVTPIVAVLDELKKLSDDELEAYVVCDRDFAPQAESIFDASQHDVTLHVISAGKFRRYRHFRAVDYITTPSVMFKNLIDLLRLVRGVGQSLWLLARLRPDVLFAKGGFVCLPIGWAARVLRIPLVIHDSDARPGLTNRLLAKSAAAIATGFPLENYTYETSKTRYTGVPVRAGCEFVDDARQLELKTTLGLSTDQKLVVSVGGGLGSSAINHAMVETASMLDRHGAKAIIIAGNKYVDETKQASQGAAALDVRPFVSDGLEQLLGAADVVVTRASATSLQELAALGKAIVAVPARQLGDQHKNAAVYAAADAAIVLSDDDLAQGRLTTVLELLLTDPSRRRQLATALHGFDRPQAASDVAAMIEGVARARAASEA